MMKEGIVRRFGIPGTILLVLLIAWLLWFRTHPWLLLTIAAGILGALGYIESIFDFKWSRGLQVLFLVLFILGSVLSARVSAPVHLVLESKQLADPDLPGLSVDLRFTPSRNEPLGVVTFAARIPAESSAHILRFRGLAGSYMGTAEAPIAPDGRSSQLKFSGGNLGRINIGITVSGATKVVLTGNYLYRSVNIDFNERANKTN